MSTASQATEDRVLSLLRALCAGLSPAGIDVVADATHTAFAPLQNRIMVAHRYLSAETPVAIGALLHEVGHALVTRYHVFRAPADAPQAVWQQALNAVEEARVHRFLRQRLPGVGCYLDALFAMDEPPDTMPRESDLVVFLAAAATWDRYPGLPFLRSFPAPAAAFDRTRDARMRYANILPPADLVVQADLPRRYADGVVPILEDEVRADVASLEAEIRCSAADALQVFIAEIWPEILTLAARDERRIGRSLADDPGLRATAARKAEAARDAALARQAMRAWTSRHGMALVPEASRDVELGSLASRLFRCFLEQSQQQPSAGLKWRASTKDCGDKGSHSVRRREEGNARMAPGTAEEMRHAQRALVDVLLRAVPRRPTRPMSGFRSGRGIDLDSVMRSAATGRDADRIWMRCPVERPALAALLLVDLSGSMRGAKCEAAIAATRLLSMALAEIRGVSWCVMGFQDVTIPFVRFGERPDAAVLARIDEMRAEIAGDRPGGNNEPRYNDDGPCLLEAADELAARPERDRLLIVISDGKPEGRRSDSDDLLQATALVGRMPRMTLWGLGIGPATDHVTRYYAQSQANIALSDIAPAIGRLLVSSLRLTA